jgi:hypothetical protein
MCDQIDYDDDAQKILKIQGKPFDPDRLYMTALSSNVFEGIEDNHAPLLEWAANHKAGCC